MLALQQLLGDDRGQSPEKVSLGVDDDNLRVRRARVGVSLRASASWSIAKPYAMRGVASMSRASRASIESIANARDVDEDARFDALGARRTLSMASVRGRRVKTDRAAGVGRSLALLTVLLYESRCAMCLFLWYERCVIVFNTRTLSVVTAARRRLACEAALGTRRRTTRRARWPRLDLR